MQATLDKWELDGLTPEIVLAWFQEQQLDRKWENRFNYRQTSKGRASIARYNKRYFSGQLGDAATFRYNATEKARTRARRYMNSPRGQEQNAWWKMRNPEVVLAQDAVNGALRYGHLVRPAICSVEVPVNGYHFGRIEAHHYKGYAPEHQLDVIWVCQRCHPILDGRRSLIK